MCARQHRDDEWRSAIDVISPHSANALYIAFFYLFRLKLDDRKDSVDSIMSFDSLSKQNKISLRHYLSVKWISRRRNPAHFSLLLLIV